MADNDPVPGGAPGYTRAMAEEIIRRRMESDFATKDWGFFDQPPAQQPSRVTAEGLNVYSRPTVAINPLTGSPVMVAADGSRTPRITQQQQQAIRDVSQLSQRAYDPGMRSADATKVNTRLPQEGPIKFPFDFSPDDQRVASAIDPATGQPEPVAIMVPMPRRRPNVTPTVFEAGTDGGLYGAKMSPRMASILNTDPRYQSQRTGRLTGPVMVAAPAPKAAPVMVAAPQAPPAYVTTQDQQDRFQTTTGAMMPGAMNNERWAGSHY